MAWEYAELFDAERKPGSGDFLDWLTDDWNRQPTAIRVGQMGYRTRTISAGPRLEAEVFPIFGRAKESTLRRAKVRMTRESQARANIRRAKEHLVRMIDANFGEQDIHLTLTYAEEPTLERCQRDIRNYLQRIKRQREKLGLENLKWIYAIGHDRGQRLHVHMILSGGIPREQLERMWGKGKTNALRLQPDESGLQGIANYIYRQNEGAKERGERAGVRMWRHSRNLKKPKVRTSDSKCSNARVKRIAMDFPNEAKEIMERLYPGYRFVQCRMYYSDIVDGVYLRCLMRRM